MFLFIWKCWMIQSQLLVRWVRTWEVNFHDQECDSPEIIVLWTKVHTAGGYCFLKSWQIAAGLQPVAAPQTEADQAHSICIEYCTAGTRLLPVSDDAVIERHHKKWPQPYWSWLLCPYPLSNYFKDQEIGRNYVTLLRKQVTSWM